MPTFTFCLIEDANGDKRIGEVSFTSDALGSHSDDPDVVVAHLKKILQSTILGDTTALAKLIKEALMKFQPRPVFHVPVMPRAMGKVETPRLPETDHGQYERGVIATALNTIFGDAVKKFSTNSNTAFIQSAKNEVSHMQKKIANLESQLKAKTEWANEEIDEWKKKCEEVRKKNAEKQKTILKLEMELNDLRRKVEQVGDDSDEGPPPQVQDPKTGLKKED